MFTRAAYFLDEYSEVLYHADDKADKDIAEMKALVKKLRRLTGEWDRRQKLTGWVSAACIVAEMLSDWGLPGTVWYLPSRERFRLTDGSYKAEDGEMCVGVYLAGATPEMLGHDFEKAMAK